MVRGLLRWARDPERPHLFLGVSGSGHSLSFDDAAGGTAPSPIEAVALSLAACTGFDVVTILRKKRQDVTGYEVHVEAEQRVGPPAVFSGIRLRHVVRGRAIDPAAVAQAVELSRLKYCAVGAMLSSSVPIEHAFEVVDECRPGAMPQAISPAA